MRGGAAHDILTPEGRAGAVDLALKAAVTLLAPECKTLSRARDRPIPGARRQPRRLRSAAWPYGLPQLRKRGGPLWAKVQRGNELAEMTANVINELEARRDEMEVGWIVENPGNSYFWELDAFKKLGALPVVHAPVVHNCMLGGRRQKLTKFLVRLMGADEADAGLTCSNANGKCDRTGEEHLGFAPEVLEGGIVKFQIADEAEYPWPMCEWIARLVETHLRACPAARGSASLDLIHGDLLGAERAHDRGGQGAFATGP